MIITYQELKEIFGGTTAADVALRLKNANVGYILGKKGQPFTTEAALNKAIGINQPVQSAELDLIENNEISIL